MGISLQKKACENLVLAIIQGVKMKFPHFEDVSVLRVPKIGVFDFQEEARHVFQFLKSADSQEALLSRSIPFPVGPFSTHGLLPVCKVDLDNSESVLQLLNWRSSNLHAFAQGTEPTKEGTKNWLSNLVLENPDRILFWVFDRHGIRLGHLGIWVRENATVELDNVIKSPDCSKKGLFSTAVKVLGSWANEILGINHMKLRVLEDNTHATEFYKKLGFIEIDRTKVEDSEKFWIHMESDLQAYSAGDDHILTAGPSIGPFEVALVSEAIRTGWNNHHSDYLNQFTAQFATYVEAEFAIPTDSCTSALHLAMWALGIGPGDEVIVPEITWVATANAVRYVGATPIFADVDPNTWCIDPESVKSLITKRTKAIIPVHLYGYVADLESLADICERNSLYLVQDAAPGIGSTLHGKGVASHGSFTCFSFQGAKLLVSGEGGVLTTNDRSLYEKAFKIADSGRKPGTFWIDIFGRKMKMSNPSAALALAQLQSVERQIYQKRQIRDWYLEGLADVPNLQFQVESPDTRSICWMTSITVVQEGFDRETFRKDLLDLGIETRPVFSPISRYPIWGEIREPKVNANYIGENSVNLPSGVQLSRNTVQRICDGIRLSLRN